MCASAFLPQVLNLILNAVIFLNKLPRLSIYHPHVPVTSHLALTGDVIALPGMIVCDVNSVPGSKYYAEE